MTKNAVAKTWNFDSGATGAGGTYNSKTANITLSGSVADGNTVTITRADGGFGTKPIAVKPVLVYDVSRDGVLPNSTLGRNSGWDSAFVGTRDTNVIAPNGTHTIEFDFSLSTSATLASVDFTSTDLFVHRHVQYSASPDDMQAYRCRYKSGTLGGTLAVGQLVRNDTGSGLGDGNTGKIIQLDTDTVLLHNDVGDVGKPNLDPLGPSDSITNTTVIGVYAEADTGFTSQLFTFEANEGQELPFLTWNNKAHRLRTADSGVSINNQYMSGGSRGLTVVENTGGSSYAWSSWPNKDEWVTFADIWYNDCYTHKMGTLDTADGEVIQYLDGVAGYLPSDFSFIQKSTANPDNFAEVIQYQVSNGAYPGSFVYYNSLYVDDSHCRVYLSDTATLQLTDLGTVPMDFMPCPPTAWADGAVSVVIQEGLFTDLSGKFLCIVDSNNAQVGTVTVP